MKICMPIPDKYLAWNHDAAKARYEHREAFRIGEIVGSTWPKIIPNSALTDACRDWFETSGIPVKVLFYLCGEKEHTGMKIKCQCSTVLFMEEDHAALYKLSLL